MTVMVQTTTNYNAAGEIVSVIVFRPVEDKMTPTDAQISAALDALSPTSHSRADVKAALTAAAEVGARDLTPQEQQLMHGALMASSIELRSRIEIAATIERCAKVVDNFKFLPEHSKGVQAIVAMTIAAAIRALLKEKP